MAVDIPLDLDSGPIVWVKAEIDATLLAALDGIARIQSGETDATIAAVRVNLHRASGAFELVGVEGLAVLVREFEAHFPPPPELPSPEALRTVASACRRLISHLEEIAVGGQPVPLRFLPEYLALGRLRGVRFGPADLFFPDLSRKPRFVAETESIDAAKMPTYLLRHRRDFQRGFLDWLRGTASANGLAIMERALAGIEAAHPLPSQRAFWWATAALLEAVQGDVVGNSTSIKQLFARIDLQIRRLVEGSTKVADRMKREVLYHVARVSISTPRCDEVKALYGLETLVPKRVPRELDMVALRPAIDRLNELVARCKEEWGAVSTQRAGAADRLVNALAELPRACDDIGVRSLSDLGNGLANVAPLISARSLTDEASLEFASCLLLLETSMQHLAALPRSFANEVATALKRLGFATSRAPIPAELIDDLGSGSLTRLAQERETVAQVCREIRSNMRQVEAALDAVFRDKTAVEDLVAVPGLLAQVSGALRLLGWNEANTIVAAASDRVSALTADPSNATSEEIDLIANVLAGFGFYLDARERKEFGSEAILESLVRTLRGESAAVATVAPGDHSVELTLGARIRTLKGEYALFLTNTGDESARATLVAGLNEVRRDAELLDDASLARAAKTSLDLLASPTLNAEALRAELIPVLGVTPPAQPVSAETQRILEASPASQDTALLEIFVEEADEVVTNVSAAMSDYLQSPGRRELLVDIRRGFHTLKGSGRMVDLTALGNAAWSVEHVLNPVLEEGRSLTAHEIELVNVAATRFRGWVSELQSAGHAEVGDNPFAEWIAKCGVTLAAPAAPSPAPKAQKTIAAASPIAPFIGAIAAISTLTASPTKNVASPDELLLSFDALPASATTNSPTNVPLTFELLEPIASANAPADAPSAAATEVKAIGFDTTEPALTSPSADHSYLLDTPSLIAPATYAAPSVAPTAPIPPIASPMWSDELEIDGTKVSRTLFSIMGDEARSHLATLDQEISLMQFDPGLLPSDSMVRASHTLCGIHRTAGFKAIGNLAGLLEDALVTVRRSKHVETHLGLFADSIETLRTAVLRLQAQMPTSEVEREAIALSAKQLDDFVAASGGERGGAAAEMARASLEDLHAFDVEEILLDFPPDVVAISPNVAASISIDSQSAHIPEPEPEPAPEPQAVADVTVEIVSAPTNEPAAALDARPEPTTIAPTAPANDAATVAGWVGAATVIGAVAASTLSAPAAATSLVQPSTTHASEPPATEPVDTQIAAIKPNLPSSTLAEIRSNAAHNIAPPPSAAAISTEDPLIGINDDIDVQVLPIFLEEALELFPAASSQLRAWRAAPSDSGNLDSLKRTLHTLKGSARMAGAMRLGELTHIVESAVEEKSGNWTSNELDRIEERFDDVAFVLDALVAGKHDILLPRFAVATKGDAKAQPSAFDEAAENAAALIAEHVETGEIPSDADTAAALPQAVELAIRDGQNATRTASPALAVATVASTAAAPTTPTVATTVATAESAIAYLRVRTDAVELLADEAGEIAINRSRIESELRGLKSSLGDLTSFVARLRTLLREIEIQGESQIQSRLDQESTFDPLEFDRYTRFQELTRSLAEGVNDVATVQQNFIKNIDDAETALAAQTRLSRSVQLRLQSLRTVPFSTVSERLYRVLRQTAKDVSKRANLDIEGGRLEIDRGVLERLMPVLEHLVRNSLAHGIEMPQDRKTRNKAEIGEINIAVKQQGNEVAIMFSDDGGGIALDRVRQRAITVGLAQPEEALNDAQLIEFIFRPGFSTADAVTAIAGRGVGMDVVRSELAALGGRVAASTKPGVGTYFTLSVPLTLAVTQVLLVEIGGAVFAIPSSLIETVRQVPSRERTIAIAAKQIEVAGKFLPYRSMSAMLGGQPDTTQQRSYSVAFVRAGDAAAAVEIDKVIGNQEVVAKPYGPQLARLPGMAGLTVLGDGKIVLLMDPLALLRTTAAGVVRSASAAEAAPTPALSPQTLAVSALDASHADAHAVVSISNKTLAQSLPPTAASASPDLVLPLAEAAASPSAQTPPTVATPMPLAARLPIVLVVDDSLTVRKITSRLLEREGYKALTAKDGLDALQVLATVNPDVILLDIEMPRMDGFEFARTIKADNRQNMIPIIMITSRTAEKHRNHAQELGVNEYLGKPYQDDELMALIAQYTAHIARPS